MIIPFRDNVNRMAGYAPGEQPQTADWVKLNTNENPYPPSPKVVEAIQQAATGRLNVYPDPLATEFREAAANLFNVDPEWILPANGSDENLTVIVRTFCNTDDLIAYPYPSYVLYETLAQIQGCSITRMPLDDGFNWNTVQADNIRQQARLVFVPNPNSPTGNLWTADQLQQVLPEDGMLILDEAYGDFADTPHQGELLKQDVFSKRMIVTRTLSKSYSLAGIRFGFAVADPEVVSGMRKVKDSYNCDAVALAAATAAVLDQDWMLQNRSKILKTRSRLASSLADLGFDVFPSQANYVWTYHPSGRHREIYEQLKQNRVLVRFMTFPSATSEDNVLDGLRITVGTDAEIDRLLEVLSQVLPHVE